MNGLVDDVCPFCRGRDGYHEADCEFVKDMQEMMQKIDSSKQPVILNSSVTVIDTLIKTSKMKTLESRITKLERSIDVLLVALAHVAGKNVKEVREAFTEDLEAREDSTDGE